MHTNIRASILSKLITFPKSLVPGRAIKSNLSATGCLGTGEGSYINSFECKEALFLKDLLSISKRERSNNNLVLEQT
jgi:hypothetical protein